MPSGPTEHRLGETAQVASKDASPAPTSSPHRRIFVVEDHAFMRRSMIAALEREPGFVVCGESDDVPDALDAIESLQPDVVLTDIALRTSSGLDLIRTLRDRHPRMPLVATTMFDVQRNERLALAAGAAGFVAKQNGPEGLVAAVRAALCGAAGTTCGHPGSPDCQSQ